MTSAAGFKRLGFALLAVAAVGLTVLTTAGYLISADTVREQAVQGIRAITGLDPVLRGPTTVSLFPSGSVSFADMVLGDPNRPALTAERLTARLRFFPLLVGRVEIADVSLERPTISVDIDPHGRSNWSGLIGALAQSRAPGAHHRMAFSEMRIDGGTIVVRDATRHMSETIDNVEFSVAWPSISKSFGITGRFVWHDQPVDAALTLADFPAALAGNRSGLEAAPVRQADEGRLRGLDQREADPEGRGHACRRRHLAPRYADLGRHEAAARRRLRPFRDQGADRRHRRRPSISPASMSISTAIRPRAC